MGKVHQQDELDDDEDEGAHHAKVIPDWEQTRHPLLTHRDTAVSDLLTCVKDAIWDEERSHHDADQHQEFEEPEPETKRGESEMQCTGLSSRGAEGFHGKREPVLDGGSGVFAAAHSDHDDGEEEEEAGHGEAHAVHRLVAHDDVAVHLVLHAWYTGPTHTEAGNLEPGKRRRGKDEGPLLLGHSLASPLIM